MTENENDLQSQLLTDLSLAIDAGAIDVRYDDSDAFSQLSANFPVRTSGIAWEELPGSRCAESPHPKPALQDYLPSVVSFLEDFARDARIGSCDAVHVIGDSVTNIALSMPLNVLLRHLVEILSMPQSTFVIRYDYAWCFCYTFEDDMYYAKSSTNEQMGVDGVNSAGR